MPRVTGKAFYENPPLSGSASAAIPPQATSIILGKKTQHLTNVRDPAALPRAMQATLLKVNPNGSRFTHVTIHLKGSEGTLTAHRVKVADLANLLGVSKIAVLFYAIFGQTSSLINQHLEQDQFAIENKHKLIVEEYVDKKDWKGLGADISKTRFDDDFFRATMISISKLGLDDDQKKLLMNEILKNLEGRERPPFLKKYKDFLIQRFGEKTFNNAIKPYEEQYASEFMKFFRSGSSGLKTAYEYLNQLPFGSKHLHEMLLEKLMPHEALNFAKFIISQEDEQTFLRENKPSDQFIKRYVSKELTEALKDDEKFQKLVSLSERDIHKYDLIFDHLAKVPTFSEDFKDFCLHVYEKGNSFKREEGLTLLVKSLLLKSIPTLLENLLGMDLEISKIIAGGMLEQDIHNPQVVAFTRNLLPTDEMEKSLKKSEDGIKENISEFYKHFLNLPGEVGDTILEELMEDQKKSSPEDKSVRIKAFNDGWQNLSDPEKKQFLERAPDFRERFSIKD